MSKDKDIVIEEDEKVLEEFEESPKQKKEFTSIAYILTFPTYISKRLWVPGFIYLFLKFFIYFVTYVIEEYGAALFIPIIILKGIFGFLYPKTLKKKKEKTNKQIKHSIPLFIGAWIFNFFLLFIMDILFFEYAVHFGVFHYKNMFVNDDNIFDIKEKEITITQRGDYYIDIHMNKDYYREKGAAKITWTTSFPEVLDVSDCQNKVRCYIAGKNPGTATVKVRFKDKKWNINREESFVVKVLDTDTLYFYSLNEKIYADRETNLKYKDLSNYSLKASYTCKDVECDVVTGQYYAIIKDGNKYLSVNIRNPELSTEWLSRFGGTEQIVINGYAIYNADFKDIVKIVDNFDEVYGFILGKVDQYTGFHSIYADQTFSIPLKTYQTYNKDFIGLSDDHSTTVLNLTTLEHKEMPFKGYIGNHFFVDNSSYYYFSEDHDHFYINCVLFDSHLNLKYNGKRFDYAQYYPDRLYTFTRNGDHKEATVYDINENVLNVIDPSIHFIDYAYYSEYMFGEKDGKIVLYDIRNNKIIDESLDYHEDSKYYALYDFYYSKELEPYIEQARGSQIVFIEEKNDQKNYYAYNLSFQVPDTLNVTVKKLN